MVAFESLGLVDYACAREIQEQALMELGAGSGAEKIFFCEHPVTITLGRRATSDSVLDSTRFPIFSVKRGGEATLHAPGQLMIYPVIAYRARRLSVRALVDHLLGAVQAAVSTLGVGAEVSHAPAGLFSPRGEKLAAIGLELRRGGTNHGVALNISNDIELFGAIIPCGRSDIRPTSLSRELGRKVEIPEVLPHLISRLEMLF